jgi:hypothetical protein
MSGFNAGILCNAFGRVMQLAQDAAASPADDYVPTDWNGDIEIALTLLRSVARAVALPETKDCIARLSDDFKTPTRFKELHGGLHHLMDLMQSELEKRMVLAIDADKGRHFRDEIYGHQKGSPSGLLAPPQPIFGGLAEDAFPSAYIDMIEAGRCMALCRNNAAVYHLVCVAEIGLRTLAWDRRVVAKKYKTPVPIELAQWGDLISGIENAVEKIKKWRSNLIREEALQFYTAMLVDVRAFNEGWRRHVMHTRTHYYESDEVAALWGHIYRFMNGLAVRGISETTRTDAVWKKSKK